MLEDKKYTAKLKCIFCQSEMFELPYEGYQPEEGEMIKCSNCGRLNDFSSIKNLEINNTVEQIKEDVHNELKKMFKKSGFKFK